MKQHFYLTRDLRLLACEILKETAHSREIKLLEGEAVGKTLKVHPEGVSWSSLYPRVFSAPQKPAHLFSFRGRAIAQSQPDARHPAIPEENPDYRFQPFLADVIDSIHSRENVLLTGGTGVGKTTHITQLAARVRQPLLRINFNGETRMSDLVGKIQVVDGETRWSDGVLPMAMRHGHWLLLDEIDFADPAMLSLLHPVLEEDPVLTLKENSGEIIRPHPNFRLFASANSIGAMQERAGSYAGTNPMNEAFLDRWQVVFVPNLPQAEEIKVLRSQAPGLKVRWAKRIVEFANKARDKSGASGLDYSGDNFSTRKTIAWARKAALHRDPLKGAKLSWLDKLPESEQEPLERILRTHFGSGSKPRSAPRARAASPARSGARKPKAVA